MSKSNPKIRDLDVYCNNGHKTRAVRYEETSAVVMNSLLMGCSVAECPSYVSDLELREDFLNSLLDSGE